MRVKTGFEGKKVAFQELSVNVSWCDWVLIALCSKCHDFKKNFMMSTRSMSEEHSCQDGVYKWVRLDRQFKLR